MAEVTLKSLVAQTHDGRLQIPEFQREVTLADEWIVSLLASVSLGYPIGEFTLLETGSPDYRFETHAVAGAPAASMPPELLLLDGQQRMSALYQVLTSGHVVQTEHRYSIDLRAALDPGTDRDAAIISVPENRRRTLRETTPDLISAELEWQQWHFPLQLVFGVAAERRRWMRGFVNHGVVDDRATRGHVLDQFEGEVLGAFEGFMVPVIMLGEETTRWSIRVHGGPDGRSLSDRFRL